ncbi:lanosterol 14-alpha demethylase [Jimgerdemannia flammicorona]|uniref:Lanosterol 14-alpha demethylase n=1 Tax=Jimgerdemannia flammicorona TaxID=994334 RepID=A0A433CLJ1_9FUNG|nr:lanosterol 14-alpha demethylase [Jimgerdemannia flammicorona]
MASTTTLGICGASLSSLPLLVRIPAAVALLVGVVIGIHVLSQCVTPKKKHLSTTRGIPLDPIYWKCGRFRHVRDTPDNPVNFLQECQKKHGDVFTCILLGKRITVCLGPDGHDFVFNGNVKNVSAAEAYKHLTTPVFGKDVVYDASVTTFMEQKKYDVPLICVYVEFVKAGLTTESFRLYVPMIVEDVLKYCQRFPMTGGRLNLGECMAEMIIITASRCLMGKEVSAALNEGETAVLYRHLEQGISPINFMIPNLPIEVNRKRDASQVKLTALFAGIVKRRRESEDNLNQDVVQTLMEQTYKDGSPLPDHHIAHLMIALLFGGQHTSATTSTWAIIHLAQDQQLIKALRQEQLEVLGSLFEPLTLDTLKDMPLLDNIVRESLRLHPPTFQVLRKILQPVAFDKTGYVIPVGHHICAAPMVSHLDERYFKDALRFDPYRWMRGEDGSAELESEVGADTTTDYGFGTVTTSARSAYLPFGAGTIEESTYRSLPFRILLPSKS